MRLSTLSAAAVLALAAVAARADVVYDTSTDRFQAYDQQNGNNFYYLGESVNPAGGGQLNTISIYFGLSSIGAPVDYTPDITLDLFPTAVDALSQTNLIGSAEVKNVSFHNDGASAFNFEDGKFVTFSFLSQGINLPSSFVFAYHDKGASDPGGLSVGLTKDNPTVGSANINTFDVYQNALPSFNSSYLDYTWDGTASNGVFNQGNGTPTPFAPAGAPFHILAQVDTVTTVPLPTSATAGLVLIGLIGATTATKRLRRA